MDGLTLAARVELEASSVARLVSATERDGLGRFEVAPGYCLAVRQPRGRSGWWSWETGDARGTLDTTAPGGWAFVATLRAEYLAGHSLEACRLLCGEICAALGAALEWRVRRLDLAADVAGWSLLEGDAQRIIARPRARLGSYEVHEGEDVPIVEHRSAVAVTGWTVCPGGEVLCRIYDKRAELRVPGREPKLAWESAGWRSRGWFEGQDVTRCEFQLRGEALDTLTLRDPLELERRLDPVWRYLVGTPGESSGRRAGWVRFADRLAERRGRSPASAAWEALRRVVFVHAANPAIRCKIARRGLGAGHALGALASMLARVGLLDVGVGVTLIRSCDPAAEVASMSDAEASAAFAELVARIGADGARTIAGELVAARGCRGALELVARRAGAAVARVGTRDPSAS